LTTHRGVLLLCAAYLGALLLLRPLDPFEWDEVLYQRALDHYDVAAHAPHPPGAPLFVGLAALLRAVVGSPQLALQLETTACAVAALSLLYALVLRLGGSRREALLAAAVLALVPGFTFHANVGLSDVPAAAGVLAVTLAGVAAIDDSRRLGVLACVAALALGVRPQVLPAVAGVGIWAIAVALRRRAARPLLLALPAGAALTAAIWIPPIALTGLARYRQAVVDHARWMAANDAALRWPGASLRSLVQYWLVNPLGPRPIAAVFWLLVLGGTIASWRAGRRRAVVVPLLGAVPYLGLAAGTLNMLSAVRFSLPAIVLVAPLAAALVAAAPRSLRRGGATLLAIWGIASLAWALPVYLLRLQPAPVWSGLEWVRDNLDPRSTLLVFDGDTRPQVEYLLAPAGFRTVEWTPAGLYPRQAPGGASVVLLSASPTPGWEVLYRRDWRSRRLLQLAFWRYDSVTVQRPAEAAGAAFSPAWRAGDGRYRIGGTGQLRAPAGGRAVSATLCPLNAPLRVVDADDTPVTIAPGLCRSFTLRPGPSGGVFVMSPEHTDVALLPVAIEPATEDAGGGQLRPPGPEYARLLAAASPALPRGEPAPSARPVEPAERAAAAAPVARPPALVLLPAAHINGNDSARWRTELVIANPSAAVAHLTLELLLAGRGDAAPPVRQLSLAAGDRLAREDALGELFAATGAGALRLSSDNRAVEARFRTYDAARTAPRGHYLPARPETAGFGPGHPAVLRGLVNDPTEATRKRTNVGVLNLGASPIEVEVTLLGSGGAPLGRKTLALGARQFTQLNDVFAELGAGAALGGTATVATTSPGGSLLAYAAVVRRSPPGVTYLTP
jgi:hypothetical protein